MDARDWLRLVLLSLVWGSTFLFVSLALHGTPGFTLVFLRVSLAAAGVLGIHRGDRQTDAA